MVTGSAPDRPLAALILCKARPKRRGCMPSACETRSGGFSLLLHRMRGRTPLIGATDRSDHLRRPQRVDLGGGVAEARQDAVGVFAETGGRAAVGAGGPRQVDRGRGERVGAGKPGIF